MRRRYIDEEQVSSQAERKNNAVKAGLIIASLPFLFGFILVGFEMRKELRAGHYEQGMGAFYAGDYARAKQELSQDVRYFPNHSLGHFYLGLTLQKQGDRSDARVQFDLAYKAEARSTRPDPAFEAKCKAYMDQ